MTEDRPHGLESASPTLYRAYGRLLQLVSMQPGEGRRALLTFLYLFLVIAAYLLIKTIRNALFISEFGAVKLPYVMLGVPVAAALFAMIYVRLARRFAAPYLIFWTLIFFISNILGFWLLASPDRPWMSPVFYVWSGAYGVIATMQVWTLANELFTTREAKRLFGIIGAGGILGGVLGAYLAGTLAMVLGTVNLMLVVAGLLLICALIVLALSRFRAVRTTRPEERPFARNLAGSLGLIAGNSHLRLLAALVFISALATSSADFQFNMIAERAVDSQDQLTAFFGEVYAKINIIAFLLQLLLTSRILAYLGIGFSILLLPLALVSGTTALLLTQTTWAGLVLKGSDGAFKHSIDRSSRELMYLPIPASLKAQTKPAIDTAIERMGDGSAGAVQLLLTAVIGVGLTGSLIANFAVLAVWILLALRLKRQYVNQLRAAMGEAPSGYAWRSPIAAEADTSRTLGQILRTAEEPARLAALEWIRTTAAPVDEDLLLERVRDDESPAVRRTALALMLRDDDVEFPPELLGWLEAEGQSALTAAIDLMTAGDADERRQRLEALLDTAGETTRLSLVASLLRRLGPEFGPFAERMFDELLAADAPSASRCAAVRALALLPRGSGVQQRLAPLIRDSDPAVASAALETVGFARRLDLLPEVIRSLSEFRLRRAARQAIRQLGAAAVPELERGLADVDLQTAVRRRLPALIADLGREAAVDSLIAALVDANRQVRIAALVALNRLRRRHPDIRPLGTSRLLRIVRDHVKEHGALLQASRSLPASGELPGESRTWLLAALEEERGRIVERVFLLLSLEYSAHDIGRSWWSVRQGSIAERANAVELLDNLLPKDLKSAVVPLVEPSSSPSNRAGQSGRVLPAEEALRMLAEGPNPWIAACAFHDAGGNAVTGLEAAARRAAETDHPLLAAEARAYLLRLKQETAR